MKHPFIHLRAQSSYSLAESALKIKKLVQLAKKHKMPAIALTDNNNMFGSFLATRTIAAKLLILINFLAHHS